MKKVGVFVRTVGDKNFNADYIKAMNLAQKTNLPLIEIDKSLYRQKAGLKPLTPAETKSVVNNVARRIKKNPELYTIFQEKYKELLEAYAKEGKKYAPGNLCLRIYKDLKNVNRILSDKELCDFIVSIRKKTQNIEYKDVNFITQHSVR